MKKANGISMISLIVTILCIILLSSMAIGTGVRYYKESVNKNTANFIALLSSAVSNRYEDSNINTLLYPYLGYYINNSGDFETIFAPKVNEPLSFSDGIWYIIDSPSATSLGIKEANEYIGTIQTGSEDVTVALANYTNGAIYLIEVSSSDIGSLDLSTPNVGGHTHRYILTAPTCTEPMKCADCGYILKEPLGHTYDTISTPTPADDEYHYNKVCTRCGMQGGYESHIFNYTHYETGGEWFHQKTCSVCNYELSGEPCTKVYSLSTDESERAINHIINCYICSHTTTEPHTLSYRYISEALHEIYCTIPQCEYVTAELHSDSNGDDVCDLCGGAIIDYTYPQLLNVSIVNSSATTEEGKFYAKYNDTIKLTFTSDKQMQNLVVTIAGQQLPSTNVTSSDNKNWTATLLLEPAHAILNRLFDFFN